MEDAKSNLDSEKIRLQAQVREQERSILQTAQQLNKAQEDLGKVRNASTSLQSEDKERQARLNLEIEERERAQQELHQVKKQVSFCW